MLNNLVRRKPNLFEFSYANASASMRTFFSHCNFPLNNCFYHCWLRINSVQHVILVCVCLLITTWLHSLSSYAIRAFLLVFVCILFVFVSNLFHVKRGKIAFSKKKRNSCATRYKFCVKWFIVQPNEWENF